MKWTKGNTMRAAIIEDMNGYGIVNYIQAISQEGLDVVLTMDPEEVRKCDAVLIPGGLDVDPSLYHEGMNGTQKADPERDKADFAALKVAVEKRMPVFGICRGIQSINVYFGGSLIQDVPTQVQHPLMHHGPEEPVEIEAVHPIRVERDSFLYRAYGQDTLTVNSYHHQAVKTMADDFRLAASTSDGVIEAMEHKELPIIAVQFHPEKAAFANRHEGCVSGDELFHYFARMIQEK